MKYLAVDTSGKNLTVIAVNGEKQEIYFDNNCGVNHSVVVMPVIEETLSKVNLLPSEVDFYACVVGAGSFTGIRIGVATVKALCFANEKPCLSITSFDSIAYNKGSGKHLAVIDAGHGGYYVCGYEDKKVTFLPKYIGTEELNLLAKEYNLISAEEVKGVKTEVLDIANGLKIAVEENANNLLVNVNDLTPLYIRKSQAEEGR